MTAIHTASTVDRVVLQKYSLQELEYSNGHKYFTAVTGPQKYSLQV